MAQFIAATIGITFFAMAIWFWVRKGKAALLVVCWFMLVAGLFITGAVRNLISKAASAIMNTLGSAGASVFGVGAAVFLFVLAMLILLELWHTMLPGKGGRGGGRGGRGGGKGGPNITTPILALLAPSMLIASNTIFGQGIGAITQLAGG